MTNKNTFTTMQMAFAKAGLKRKPRTKARWPRTSRRFSATAVDCSNGAPVAFVMRRESVA